MVRDALQPTRPPAAAGGRGRRLAVALDATPLLGAPTGVGVFVSGALGALSARSDLVVSGYAVSWRRRHLVESLLPAGVRAVTRPMPARPLQHLWRHADVPPLEWFTGPEDVVHGTNFVVPPTRRAARVVTVHDLTCVRFPQLAGPATLVFPGLVRRAVAGGAWVHTPSAFVADEVCEEFGVPPERVRAVPHGVGQAGSRTRTDRHRTGGADAPARARTAPVDLPAGAGRYVLAVGTAEPRKDLPGLVRAFAEVAASVPDVALVLAGQPGWGEDALRRAVDASGLAGRIVRTGWVPAATLDELVAAAAVLAYPSLYEGFGLPPLEAMAEGVPVVTTRAGAIPEVVGDAAVLVDPGDSAALADALRRVLEDDELRRRLSERGRARAAGFTWARCAEGLASLYADAAAWAEAA